VVDKSGLRVNQLVEIELDSYLYKGVFPSRIEEITSEAMCLGIPIRFGVLVPVQVGDKITVNYIHDQEAYCFKTRVLGRKREPLPVLVAELPREIIKIQRRNHVRLEISLPMSNGPHQQIPTRTIENNGTPMITANVAGNQPDIQPFQILYNRLAVAQSYFHDITLATEAKHLRASGDLGYGSPPFSSRFFHLLNQYLNR
jgi:hypothetical protein